MLSHESFEVFFLLLTPATEIIFLAENVVYSHIIVLIPTRSILVKLNIFDVYE